MHCPVATIFRWHMHTSTSNDAYTTIHSNNIEGINLTHPIFCTVHLVQYIAKYFHEKQNVLMYFRHMWFLDISHIWFLNYIMFKCSYLCCSCRFWPVYRYMFPWSCKTSCQTCCSEDLQTPHSPESLRKRDKKPEQPKTSSYNSLSCLLTVATSSWLMVSLNFKLSIKKWHDNSSQICLTAFLLRQICQVERTLSYFNNLSSMNNITEKRTSKQMQQAECAYAKMF